MDRDEILRIAKAARLELTEEEINEFLPQLKEVLDNFSIIDGVDTTNTEISLQPIELSNSYRDDIVEDSISVELAFKNTQLKKEDYFKGPKAI